MREWLQSSNTPFCSCSCSCTCTCPKKSSSFALLCSLILTVEESVSHRLHLNDYRLHPILVVRVASIRKQCQRLSKIHCWTKAKAVKTNYWCSEDQLYREGREQGILCSVAVSKHTFVMCSKHPFSVKEPPCTEVHSMAQAVLVKHPLQSSCVAQAPPAK